MDDRPLLSDDDPRFPQYFRLYWNELSRLINPQASRDILKDLANILEEDTKDDWFAFAFNVLTNPARMVAELVSKEKNLGLKNPTKEERQEKLGQMTDLMYEKTLQTFTYEVMFNPQTIAYLDEHNKNHDPQLWKDTHLYGYSKNDVSVQTFFKHFYPEEDPEMLDSLVYTFMNLDKVCDLDAKLFEKSLCSDDDKYVEDRARRFFRELPKCGKFDNIWFYELIRTMVHGEHMAALSVLLPNWDLTLKQKEQEAQNVRNQDRNIHLEEEADLEHILVLRPPADFRGAQDKIDPEDDPLNQLVLRDYQEELVEHARRGENAIVVAPTGAGKTEVCIYVAREHIDRREREGKASRVVMLVPKIPLVQQQEERFRNYLRHRRLITGLHGAMNLTGTQKHDIFMKADITIMTPEILSNLLRSGRKAEKVYLADISLLIFDEIHHCNQNHVYNRIMQYIHDYTRIPEEQKPQILGLTATPLPKNQTEERNALEEIYKLMANANCYQLSTVVNNIESLERTVAKPDEVFVKENRHEKNAYEEQLKLVVGTILKKIDPDLKALVKVGKTSGFFLTQQEASPKYVGSPGKFTAQLNALKDKLSKLTSTIGDKNKLLIAIDYLLICSKALAINELMPCYFANEFLEKEIGNTQNFSGNAHTRELFSYYEKEQRNLEKISNEAKPSQNNPLPESKAIVKSLLNQIRTNFEEKPDSRCIIFVQERAMAKRLKEYLAEIRILGSPSKVAFVTSVKGSDGMTVEVQRATLQNFHTGAVQIIVATSVLDEGIDVSACNLIIKYNTSSSAVAKIQRAGRVRAQGGRSIFICLHDGVAESEYQAILTGNMMKKCVKVMKDSGPSQVRSKVDEQKKNLAVNRQHQKKLEEELRQRLQGKQYDILCQTCDKVVCDSDRIRVDGSHHCIVDSDIWNHVGIHVSFKKGAKFVDSEHQVLGSLFCIGPMELKDLGNYWVSDSQPDSRCGTKLGDVYKIAGTYFPVLNASKVKFRQRVSKMEEDQECVLSKNWKNVREQYFYVPNLHDADIRKMLNGLKQSGNALMEHRLEEALKRISAEFNRDISRRKAEFERAERIRSGPKEKFATYNDDDDVYGGSELTGFGDAFDLSLLDEDEEE